jgi:hypothetical protein
MPITTSARSPASVHRPPPRRDRRRLVLANDHRLPGLSYPLPRRRRGIGRPCRPYCPMRHLRPYLASSRSARVGSSRRTLADRTGAGGAAATESHGRGKPRGSAAPRSHIGAARASQTQPLGCATMALAGHARCARHPCRRHPCPRSGGEHMAVGGTPFRPCRAAGRAARGWAQAELVIDDVKG